MTDVQAHNRQAWDRQVQQGNPWTQPVSSETIAAARRGEWQALLTDSRPVPRDWFPPLTGLKLLCLASGGGQQGPILAAAGAQVTVFDLSPQQLARDRMVAEREGLVLEIVEGDMADLSVFSSARFDLVFHPVSNTFIADVRPVWREAFRVLRTGGLLLTGFINPMNYIFDQDLSDQGIFQVKYPLPYSDLHSLEPERRQAYADEGLPLEFSHTLQEQIGGQMEAGFLLTGFYEDQRRNDPLAQYMPSYFATRALKPG